MTSNDVLTRLHRRRDPLIDTTAAQRIWAALKRWAPGLAFALAIALTHAKLAEWDANATQVMTATELANTKARLASLHDAHRHRTATGCSTMFYLIQGDLDDGLWSAQQALEAARGPIIAARPTIRGPAK